MAYELAGYGYGAEIEVGAEDDDIEDILSGLDEPELGARRARRRSKARLVPIVPNRLSNLPLGLGVTALTANQSTTVTLTPQLPFKPYRLLTNSTGVRIDDIRVGNASQFVAAGSIPSEIFAPNAVGTRLKGDTAVPGVDIIISITDTSGAANSFSGALIGDVAQR